MSFDLGAVGPWTLLVLAGLLEIVWALGFKYVPDDASFALHAGVFAPLVVSFALLVAALKHLPAGTAYAVWTGIGASGVAIIGMVFLSRASDSGAHRVHYADRDWHHRLTRVACVVTLIPMPFGPGTRLGAFEIVSLLGAGGPPPFAGDPGETSASLAEAKKRTRQ